MSTPTIKIAVSQADATLVQTTTLTAGMQNLPVVKFSFTDEWAGLGKTAVCRAGSVCLDVLVLNDQITVPYECLETAGVNLIIGVYGADTQVVIPTVWCSAGEILDGTEVEEASNVGTPTTDLVDQMLGYAEDVATAAQTLEDYAIRSVNVDNDDADDFGTASVEASLSGSGDTRALNLKFSDLKGNGIESVEFSELGTYRGRLQITESDGTVTTFDGIKEALDYLDELTDESEESALKAEGYAVGTQDGDPSQTYATINAQYFAGVASTAATNAGTAKTAAETAQGKAETAQGKAETAQAAAELAATGAANSEATATSKAEEAASSSESASDFASAAGESATLAEGYKDSASSSASDAESFATSASGSASDASGYASAASGYATNASNSATAASGSANSASGSATSASTNALKAEGFAVGEQNGTAVASGSPYYHNNAEYYASKAADSATAAAGSASDAAESAATFTTDTTLSVSGKAADAAAVGNLKSALTQISGNTELQFEDGRRPVYDDGTTLDYVDSVVSDDDYVCLVVPCSPGDIFTINAYGGATTKAAYGWANSEKKGIERGGTNSLINGAITAPTNAAYLIVNNRLSKNANYYAYKGYMVNTWLNDLESSIGTAIMPRSNSKVTSINDTTLQGFFQWPTSGHPSDEPTFTSGKTFQLLNLITTTGGNARSVQLIFVQPSDTSEARIYYRYKISTGWTDWLEIINSSFPTRYWTNGKTINWIGDSIVSGGDFDDRVCTALGMTENEYGISGSTIALKGDGTDGRDAVVARYSSMSDSADIIAVSAGTNDWMYAWSPVGDIDDPDDGTSNTTFYGALKTLCNGLITKYPDKVIFFTTPIKRAQPFDDGDGGTYTPDDVDTTPFSKNKYGLTLGDYADIIKEVCGYYSIPVLDMYRESGMNPSNATQRALLFTDKTHPNTAGKDYMAKRVTGWLTQLSYDIPATT